jgi:hypothetical protein
MKIWFLWLILWSGQELEAGQYQSQEACIQAAKMQRAFWIKQTKHPRRMECRLEGRW